jgi:hypothetical protein
MPRIGRTGADTGRPAALNVSIKNFRARALYERLGFKAAREKLRFSALRIDLVAAMAERNKTTLNNLSVNPAL